MNEQIKDGGPAFPLLKRAIGYHADIQQEAEGLSLRDYFAAKALHAELVTCGVPGEACDALIKAIEETGETPEDHMARCAYEMADAMLRAREVKV